jgi:hypothetical protein
LIQNIIHREFYVVTENLQDFKGQPEIIVATPDQIATPVVHHLPFIPYGKYLLFL